MNYTYILKCGDNSLYTGWTNDIEHRLAQHRSGKAEIKRLSRVKKELLLEDETWRQLIKGLQIE